jgi:hypothetical protein
VLRRAFFASLFFAACYGPTEIRVDISTNACQSLAHTDVYVNGQNVTRAKKLDTCPKDLNATVDVGTITLLPTHGIDSNVDIEIVGDVGGGAACDSPDTTDGKCIVARRSLDFIPHQSLPLPIFLDSACAGVTCGDGASCVLTQDGPKCISDCLGTKSCPVDGGGIEDVIIPDVIVVDSGPPLQCQIFTTTTLGPPTFSWSFNNGTIGDDGNLLAPQPPMAQTTFIVADPPTFCADDYMRSKAGQALATNADMMFTKFAAPSFMVGLAYNAAADGPLLSLSSSSQFGGWTISLASGAIQVSLNSINQLNPVYVGKPPTTGGWHRFGFQLATNGVNSVLTPYVDGLAGVPIKAAPYQPGGTAALTVGIADVDNVVFYTQ